MNEKKKRSAKKKGKKNASGGKGSLLTRLFGGLQKKRPKTSPKKKTKPLTPRQRSIAEIQQMAKIGQRDPERLARLLVTMLGKERAKEEADRQEFEQQVWNIVHREDDKKADASDDGDAPASKTT